MRFNRTFESTVQDLVVAIGRVLDHPNAKLQCALDLCGPPVPVSVGTVALLITKYAIPNEEVHLLRKELP